MEILLELDVIRLYLHSKGFLLNSKNDGTTAILVCKNGQNCGFLTISQTNMPKFDFGLTYSNIKPDFTSDKALFKLPKRSKMRFSGNISQTNDDRELTTKYFDSTINFSNFLWHWNNCNRNARRNLFLGQFSPHFLQKVP